MDERGGVAAPDGPGAKGPHPGPVEPPAPPRPSAVDQAVRADGEADLARPAAALFWSALAAGLSLGVSFVLPGLVRAQLPEAGWRPLVTALGYPIGFVLVILGRQQLFTQTTVTVVLPLLERRDRRTLDAVGRVWGIVVIGNLLGALLVGWAVGNTPLVDPGDRVALAALAAEPMAAPFATSLLRAIVAGWLIALIAWLLPFAEAARAWVVFVVAYVVGVAAFPQIVTAAIAAFYATPAGTAAWGPAPWGFPLRSLAGNPVGGVVLVALLNHAQATAGGRASCLLPVARAGRGDAGVPGRRETAAGRGLSSSARRLAISVLLSEGRPARK